MKKLLKSILPVGLANKLRTANEANQLKKLPVEACNLSPLRKITAEMLTQIFKDDKVAEAYQNIQQTITDLELPEYTGGVNIGDQKAIFYLIEYFKPKNVLEVGTFVGCSTVHIGLALRDIPGAKLTTVDIRDVNDLATKPWIGNGSKRSPLENIERINCQDKVSFVPQNSLEYLRSYKSKKYDLIFLDGSHKATDVYHEILKSLEILNEGGIILLHDYFPKNNPLWEESQRVIPGPYLAVERLRKEHNDAGIVPLGRLPWITKYGKNMTSLAIFTKK